MLNALETAIKNLRQAKPLILCLTNYVTMDIMANSLLAIGAVPIMSVCHQEFEELIKIAQAVNINLGTLDEVFVAQCNNIAQYAKQYQKPLVLDPVGAGASVIRTQSARELMTSVDIIRGNASEVIALFDHNACTRGVETLNSTLEAKSIAEQIANKFACTVVVSGAEDFVTNGIQQASASFGSPLMPLVTGMGCALTAIISAFRAVISDSFTAAKLATCYFGLCGNIAQEKANKPSVFRTSFIDELYSSDFEAMRKYLC